MHLIKSAEETEFPDRKSMRVDHTDSITLHNSHVNIVLSHYTCVALHVNYERYIIQISF